MHNYISRGFSLTIICLLATVATAQKQPSISWQRALGGSGNDRGVSVTMHAPMSGFTICGTTNSTSGDGDVTFNHGDDDIWVVKLSPTGVLVWEKTYGNGLADRAAHIVATSDGGYVVGGSTTDTNQLQWWIFKIDSVGTMLWEKTYGGSATDSLSWIDIANDGSIYCVGHSMSGDRDFPVNQGNNDIWIMKLNANGELIWKKPFAGSGQDNGFQIRATADGGCVLAGSTSSTDGDMTDNTTGSADGFVAKLSAGGDVDWKKIYGTGGAESFNALQALHNGGYIVVGITEGAGEPNGDYYIVRLDPSGNMIWEKLYGGSGRDEATAVLEIAASGYQVIGTSTSVIDSIPTHRGLSDWLVYRIDTNGNNGEGLFARWFGGTGDDRTGGSLLSAFPGYLAVGSTNSNDQFVTGNHGNSDVYVVRYGGGEGLRITPPFVFFDSVAIGTSVTRDLLVSNSAGEPFSGIARLAGSSGGQYSIQSPTLPISLAAKQDTILTVTFSPTVIGTHIDSLYIDADIGQKLRVTLHGVGALTGSVGNDELDLQPMTVYPNPAHDNITVTLTGRIGTYSATIEDLKGEEVKRFVFDEPSDQLTIRDLPAGMYMLNIYNNNLLVSKAKFIKQ